MERRRKPDGGPNVSRLQQARKERRRRREGEIAAVGCACYTEVVMSALGRPVTNEGDSHSIWDLGDPHGFLFLEVALGQGIVIAVIEGCQAASDQGGWRNLIRYL